jgi:hypothetical protein
VSLFVVHVDLVLCSEQNLCIAEISECVSLYVSVCSGQESTGFGDFRVCRSARRSVSVSVCCVLCDSGVQICKP